ncbi:MAG: hypothetical protein ACRDTR_23475 [Rubrobacter sp.]
MVRKGFLRFVFLGAGGFAAGGALAGASWLLLPSMVWASALLVVLGEAIGGASLGLALRDRGKALVLALLGAVGFTVGTIVAAILAFLGLLPASESGATNAMGAGAAGILVGAVGGGLLGLSLRDPRKIILLSFAGAVGFGVGLVAKFFLEQALRLGVAEDLLLTVSGVIGGAALGAALGSLVRVAERPRGERLLWVGGLAGLPLIAGLFVVFFTLPYRGICGEEERAAFSEFPQYGGLEMEPRSDSMTGGCAVIYETPAPPEKVAGYLANRLESHGWTVQHRLEARGEAGEKFGGTLVTAGRDGLRYGAYYESLRFYEPPRPGTHVAVHLSESEIAGH